MLSINIYPIPITEHNKLLNLDYASAGHTGFQPAGSYQPLATNLTSLAGLTYASLSFVKMSAAGTFSLDTNTYYKSGDSPTFADLTVTDRVLFDTTLYNTRLGYLAMPNAAGGNNTGVGQESLEGLTSGSRNTAVGHKAGEQTVDGFDNTYLGYEAGGSNIHGSFNTYLGSWTGYIYGNISSGNVFIGYHAGNAESGSNKLYIANDGTATPLIYGDFWDGFLQFNVPTGLVVDGDTEITGGLTLGTLDGLLKGTAGVVSAITDSSANWDAAYIHKTTEDAINGLLKIDGAGGYSAAAAGTDYDNYWSRSGTTISPRTSGDAILTTGHAGLGSGGSIVTNAALYIVESLTSTNPKGIYCSLTNTRASGSVAYTYAFAFVAGWSPTSAAAARTCGVLTGAYGSATTTLENSESYAHKITVMAGFYPNLTIAEGTSVTGSMTAALGAMYYAPAATTSAHGAYTVLCSYYDSGQTVGVTNWGFYGLSAQNYFAGNIGIGITPAAYLHLKAGTAAASTAPLKIAAGIVLTSTEAGAIESDGTHLYWTDTGGTRRQLDN